MWIKKQEWFCLNDWRSIVGVSSDYRGPSTFRSHYRKALCLTERLNVIVKLLLRYDLTSCPVTLPFGELCTNRSIYRKTSKKNDWIVRVVTKLLTQEKQTPERSEKIWRKPSTAKKLFERSERDTNAQHQRVNWLSDSSNQADQKMS